MRSTPPRRPPILCRSSATCPVPPRPSPCPGRRWPASTRAAARRPGSSAHLVAVFGGVSRKGVWQVPAEIDAVNVFGGTELDLREAVLTSRETRIRAVCILGGMEIVVPPEMHVVDSGIAVMGGREIRRTPKSRPAWTPRCSASAVSASLAGSASSASGARATRRPRTCGPGSTKPGAPIRDPKSHRD